MAEISKINIDGVLLDLKDTRARQPADVNYLGMVQSGGDVTIQEGIITVNDDSHNHKVKNISDLTATASEINVLDGATINTTELNTLKGIDTQKTVQTHLNDTLVSAKEYTDTAESNAKTYADNAIAKLVGAAPAALDTVYELAEAIEEHQDVTDLLTEAIGNKASKTDLDSHAKDTSIHITQEEKDNLATKESVNELEQTISELNATNTASGSPILLTDSADGTLIDFKGKGRSTQKQYSGKNLLIYPYYNTTHTEYGITWTDLGDGTIGVSSGATTADCYFVFRHNVADDMVYQILPKGTYTISGGTSKIALRVYKIGANGEIIGSILAFDNGNGATFELTEETRLNLQLRIGSGTTIDRATVIKPMLKLASITDSTYEPYVGGTAAPNPDYPQEIKSVADSGYFDGELLQGYYDTNGLFVSTSNYMCSKNLIPCKEGDTVKFMYGANMSSVCFVFYDKDMNVVGRPSINGDITEYQTNAPANTKYMHFLIREIIGNVAIANAKHITVTINGKYALIVKSKGKNLLRHTVTTQTINGVTFTVNEDKSVTVNGRATDNATLYVTQSMPVENGKTYIVNGAPNGASVTNYYMVIQKRLGTTFISSAQVLKEDLSVKCDGTFDTLYVGIAVLSGQSVSNVTFYPMVRPVDTDDTYEPYKETVSYIPLNEPLRGIGNVTDEVSPTKVTRRFAEVVFDGVNHKIYDVTSDYHVAMVMMNVGSSARCSHFTYNHDTRLADNQSAGLILLDGEFCIRTYFQDRFYLKKSDLTTVDEWNTWLQNNPITVQYELAEPIVETIEPVDIVTYDNVTHISVSDNAEMEIEYFRNSQDGQVLADVQTKLQSQIDELSGAIEEHQDVTDALNTAIGNKVDKVNGKGLSTNDYTTSEKNKLAGVAEGANKYTHPSYTAKSSGLYKVTVDASGHVSAATAIAKADITALGIPAQDTVYTHPNSGVTAGTYQTVTVNAAGHVTAATTNVTVPVNPTAATITAMPVGSLYLTT